MVPVTGTVSLDGQPIASGEVIFRAEDGKGPTHAGKIKDGTFSFSSSPGKKRVEITAMRPVPGRTENLNPGSPPSPVLEQCIPEAYNSRSILTAEVKKDARQFPFDLKSKP